MSYFKAIMHQIRFRLGLRPRPRWGSSQRSPRSPSWIYGVLLLREGKDRGGRGREGKRERGKEGKGEGEGGEREGREKWREGEGREGEVVSWLLGGCTPLEIDVLCLG